MTRRPETPAELLARQYDTTPSVQNEDNLLVLVTPASSDIEPVFAFRLSKRAALELGARLRAGEAVPVEPLDLIGLEYHACSSGTDTPPMVRRQILSACAEIRALREFVAMIPSRTKHGPSGSGRSGACDPDCLKCRVEALLR